MASYTKKLYDKFRHGMVAIEPESPLLEKFASAATLQGKSYFVDFQNLLCSRQEKMYQFDGIHLEDAGRQMVARALAGLLKKDFLSKRQLSLQPQ